MIRLGILLFIWLAYVAAITLGIHGVKNLNALLPG